MCPEGTPEGSFTWAVPLTLHSDPVMYGDELYYPCSHSTDRVLKLRGIT